MKAHKGMRPQDVVILLKIASREEDNWLAKDLAAELNISPAEVSGSLQRSAFAGLIDPSKRKVQKEALLDFICYGLKYVFPALPGPLTRGIPTAYSAPIMKSQWAEEEKLVWPDPSANERGMMIEPLFPISSDAIKNDSKFYDLLALAEVMRVGKIRDREKARMLLQERLK
jgi:hypothetical protein